MKRYFVSAIALAFCTSAFGQASAPSPKNELVGVWKLNSFVIESVETKERRGAFGGSTSTGYAVITPERFTAVITGVERKPPQTDEDRLANFRTLVAYSGLYTVDGNKFTTKVDVAWTEAWKGTDQVRFFRVEGGKLFIETAPFASTQPSGGQVRGILEWERAK